MKVSDFLRRLHSHSIYDATELAKKFEAATGKKAGWSTYSVRETRSAIKRRGLGGNVRGKSKDHVAWGYQVAISLARELVVGFVSTKLGRGSAFWEAVDAIAASGN